MTRRKFKVFSDQGNRIMSKLSFWYVYIVILNGVKNLNSIPLGDP